MIQYHLTMFFNCSLQFKSLLAWTLLGQSFCPRKVIAPRLFDPFLAQACHMTPVFAWIYFMPVSENDRDFMCPASSWRCFSAWLVMSTLYWRVVPTWPHKWLWPEDDPQIRLMLKLIQAHREKTREDITSGEVSPWWIPHLNKLLWQCGLVEMLSFLGLDTPRNIGLEPDLSSTQSQNPSWLCPVWSLYLLQH